MTATKKRVAGPKQDEDLRTNPGIGQSKGSYAAGDVDPASIEGENTTEGDVENDPEPSGAIDPRRLGRTNK